MATALTPFCWTRARYDRLALTGILDDTYAELINGQIVEVDVTRTPMHDNTIHRVTEALVRRVGIRRVHAQRAIALGDYDEPEPDVMVVAEGSIPFDQHPTTAQLVVEVAVTSQDVDLGAKRDAYARAGIPAYWVVDPAHAEIHVFCDPRDGHYTDHDVVYGGVRIEPFNVWADDLLPPKDA